MVTEELIINCLAIISPRVSISPVAFIVVKLPAAALLAPMGVPSIAPPSILTLAKVPTEVIFGCAAVTIVPPMLVACTLPNEPVEAIEPLKDVKVPEGIAPCQEPLS